MLIILIVYGYHNIINVQWIFNNVKQTLHQKIIIFFLFAPSGSILNPPATFYF